MERSPASGSPLLFEFQGYADDRLHGEGTRCGVLEYSCPLHGTELESCGDLPVQQLTAQLQNMQQFLADLGGRVVIAVRNMQLVLSKI